MKCDDKAKPIVKIKIHSEKELEEGFFDRFVKRSLTPGQQTRNRNLADRNARRLADLEKDREIEVGDEQIISQEPASNDSSNGSGTGSSGGGDKNTKSDIPLSILKKNPDTKSLGSSGAKEMPLNSFLIKQMKFGPKASNRIAINVAKQLKAKGIPVSESRILEILKQVLNEVDEPRAGTSAERSARRKRAISNRDAQRKKAAAAQDAAKKAKDDPMAPGFAKSAARKDAERAEKSAQDSDANVDRAVGDIKARRQADKEKRKGIEKRAKSHPLGSIAQTILTLAARSGSRKGQFDKQFLTALGEDPKMQDKAIANVVKMMRRQMKRRGMNDAEIKKALNLKEQQIAEAFFKVLLEHYNKTNK